MMNKSEPPIEENLALAASTNKGGGIRFPSQKSKGKKFKENQRKLDLSKIRCYKCQKFGHFAKDFPNQKRKFKGRHHASSTDLDDMPQQNKSRESNPD